MLPRAWWSIQLPACLPPPGCRCGCQESRPEEDSKQTCVRRRASIECMRCGEPWYLHVVLSSDEAVPGAVLGLLHHRHLMQDDEQDAERERGHRQRE